MNIPEDLVAEILSRLPVKSLVRFKKVCKSWHNLIKHPHFISKHLANWTNSTTTNKHNAHLLISRRDEQTKKRVISLFTNDTLNTFIDQKSLPFVNETFGHIRLLGPCNGIVCLYSFPDNIAPWNPAIREFKRLPKSPIPRPVGKLVLGGDIGFGYDPITNDYKAQDDETELILKFDMKHEKFRKTPLPLDIGDLEGENRVTRAILPFNELIVLVAYAIDKEVFDIWTIKGFGVGEMWTRFSRIGAVSGVERRLGFWKNGQIILESSCRELSLYDYGTGKIRNVGVHGKRERSEVLLENFRVHRLPNYHLFYR